MTKIAFSIFISGIILGAGPCLATCGPILISYIAATKNSPLGALKSWFIFSISRVFIYTALGALAGIIGSRLYQSFYWESAGFILWFASGIFICLLGVLTMFGKNTASKICQNLQGFFIKKDTKSIVGLGVLIGLFPCAPLIGILSYISMVSVRFYQGVILAFLFGLGTVISPLFFLGLGAGFIPKFSILQGEKAHGRFQRLAGAVLFFLGMHILVKTVAGFIKTL